MQAPLTKDDASRIEPTEEHVHRPLAGKAWTCPLCDGPTVPCEDTRESYCEACELHVDAEPPS